MSIFNIDWNNDGKIDFKDTIIDAMIIDSTEQDKEDNKHKTFSSFGDND